MKIKMRIWRVRYKFDGIDGHWDQFFLSEERALLEALRFKKGAGTEKAEAYIAAVDVAE